MTETIEKPASMVEAMDQAYMAAAEKADRGEDFQIPTISANESDTRADRTDAVKPESSTDTEPESNQLHERNERREMGEQPRDEQGRFAAKDGDKQQPVPDAESRKVDQPEPKADDPGAERGTQETPYAKAQREQQRQQNLLRDFEQNKARFREEQAAFERQRAEWEQQRRQQLEQAQQPRNGNAPEFTSQQYAEFAQQCREKAKLAREKGDYDSADENAERAIEASNAALKARDYEAQQEQGKQRQHLDEALQYDVAQLIQSTKELQDASSPLAQEFQKVLGEYAPIVENIPLFRLANGRIVGGPSLAAEVAKLRLQAGSVSVLEKENKELKTKLEEANRRMGLSGSGPVSPSVPKGVADMTEAELDQWALREAERADATITSHR